MASTYVNDLRLNEMATGDASGSWGTVTNTNLELIGEAFSYGTETIGDADSTLTIADGAADAARSFYLKITSSVDLTTTRIVTLGPNTVSKVWMIENATTGSQVITIKQGSGATINVPNGQVKMISTDGAGSGGAVLDLLVDVDLTGTTTLVNLDVSGAVDIAGDLTLSAGGDGALRFTAASSVKVLDNNAAALVFEEADNAYMTFVTTDGSEAVKFDKALDINAATQIDATVTVGVDDTGYDVKFFGATTGKSLLWDESADSLIVTGSTSLQGGLEVGVDDTGYDVKFFGATAGAYMLWDESADDLILGGAAGLSVNSTALVTGVLTTTAATVFNGGFASNAASTITTADNLSGLIVACTDADANTGPTIQLKRDSSTTAANDLLGNLIFVGENDADEATVYANIGSQNQVITNGSESGRFFISTIVGGTEYSRFFADATETVINENSRDLDFRVESDTDANALFVEGSSGNVGIGTSSPNFATISVRAGVGNPNDRNAILELLSSGGGGSFSQIIYGDVNTSPTTPSPLTFSYFDGSSSSERMRIDSTGGLITNPAAGGHAVFNENSVDADFRVESDANDHMLFVDGGNNRVSINSNSTSYDSAAPLHIGPNSTYSYGPNIQGTVNRTYVHYIGAGGGSGNNVYIHGYQVDNPAGGNYLRVAGGLSGNGVSGVQQSQDGIIYVYDTGKTTGDADYTPTVQHRIDFNSGGSVVFNDQGLDLDFRIESDTNTHALFVEGSSGNVLVGTDSGGAKLTVKSNATAILGFGVYGDTTGDTVYNIAQFGKYDNDSTTSQVFINFVINNGNAANGQINANGSGAVAFGSWSDRRLKENITDLPNQLANITALRPVEFDYIESEGGGHQLGFIAQEVEEIYPDLVGERQDGMKTLSGMGKMEARLIKAIQEQQATIEALTARIAALES
jgi:hypothetical protein